MRESSSAAKMQGVYLKIVHEAFVKVPQLSHHDLCSLGVVNVAGGARCRGLGCFFSRLLHAPAMMALSWWLEPRKVGRKAAGEFAVVLEKLEQRRALVFLVLTDHRGDALDTASKPCERHEDAGKLPLGTTFIPPLAVPVANKG